MLIVVVGCGNPSGVNEKLDPQAKAEAAPAAIEGASKTVAATVRPAGDAPAVLPAQRVAKPADKAAPPSTPVEPADSRQLAKVLDLGKLPVPEGARVDQQSATQLQAQVLLTVPAVVDFYLGKLQALGWRKVGDPAASLITDSYASVSLGKDGYQLLMMVMAGKPKEARVTLAHMGNLDTRTLPRVAGAEDQYSSPSSSLYFASAKVDEAAASLRALLTAAGWQEYEKAFSQKAERPDAQDLSFRKKAYDLGVSVSKPATQPDKIAVQYIVSTFARDLPAPPDARHVEVEDFRWILMCDVPRDVAAAAEYYRTAMPTIGFSRPPHETPLDKKLILSFESEEGDLMLVQLAGDDENTTKVKLEGYTAAFRAEMKKAEAEALAKRKAQEKTDAVAKAKAAKDFEARSKKQDEIMDAAIGDALSGALDPSKQKKQTELSQKIQDDVKAKLEKALQGMDAHDTSEPDDQPAEKPAPKQKAD